MIRASNAAMRVSRRLSSASSLASNRPKLSSLSSRSSVRYVASTLLNQSTSLSLRSALTVGNPPRPGRFHALAAAHALSLRLEELRDVLPLPERRRMTRRPAMLEIRLVIRRSDHAPYHTREAGGEGQGPIPHPASRIPFNPPSHIPSPHTAPHVPPPSCDATRPATTRATT